MTKLRNEIEKILDTNHCSSCLTDNCYYEEEGGGIGVDICCFHQPAEATDQILSLLEGSLPKEKKYPTKQRQTGKTQALFDLNMQYLGWNACLQEIKEKMK